MTKLFSKSACLLAIAAIGLTGVGKAREPVGGVQWHQKISETQGNFMASILGPGDQFGTGVTAVGDFDGDGVTDVMVGTRHDVLHILFLNSDGTVHDIDEVSLLPGSSPGDEFGASVISLGDLDGDGVVDVAVGVPRADDGGANWNADRGAVEILFFRSDGGLKSHQRISDTDGGFTGVLSNGDFFGYSVAALGDIDGDSVCDLAVGAPLDNGQGSSDKGAVWILFLNTDGTVKSQQKVGDGQGGFHGILMPGDHFGSSVAALGNVDADTLCDLAVGAPLDSDGNPYSGAVWILFPQSNGTVKLSYQKISSTQGGFLGSLDENDNFGSAVAPLGDLDGDGVPDLLVGARQDDDGGTDRGAAWMLFLNGNGSVKSYRKFSDTQGGFTGGLADGVRFGASVASLGDLDGDGVSDLAVGANNDDEGGTDTGALWVLFLTDTMTVDSYHRISATEYEFTKKLDYLDAFGHSLAALDVDDDFIGDVVVGAPWDDDRGVDRGAVWVLFLNSDGTVRENQKISSKRGFFTGSLDNNDQFGISIAAMVDIGPPRLVPPSQYVYAPDLAVGAYGDGDGGPYRGAVWILFLNPDGTVQSHQKISSTQGGFAGTLDDADAFGFSVACAGYVDDDDVLDLAVAAPYDDDGAENMGAVWILFLNPDGTVKGHQKISDTQGNFSGVLSMNYKFGWSMAALWDLNGDGVSELAVGAPEDSDGGSFRGAVWILFLDSDGTVKGHQKISSSQGGFTGTLDDSDGFGYSVNWLPDLDGDGVYDMVVGATGDDDGGTDRGAMWVLFLNSDGTVKTQQKISDTEGSFNGTLDNEDYFGSAVVSLPNHITPGGDIVVGAQADDDGGADRGAIWVLGVDRVTTAVKDAQTPPFGLRQNRPNPFNPATEIGFSVSREGLVRLAVYDASGRLVRKLVDRTMVPGEYTAEWDGRDDHGNVIASGVYFYSLSVGDRTLARKAVCVK